MGALLGSAFFPGSLGHTMCSQGAITSDLILLFRGMQVIHLQYLIQIQAIHKDEKSEGKIGQVHVI